MKWSRLKKTVEDKFADSVKGRVHVYATRYTTGSYFMVRGWITIDKNEIADFSTPDNSNKFGWNTPDINERISPEDRNAGFAVEKGEFSRYDFTDACFEYINMNLDLALSSNNPIIRSFAMLDRRLGKRRLKIIKEQDRTDTHPLVLKMLDLRLECEMIK